MAIVIDLNTGPGEAPATGPYAGPLAYLARYGATEAVQTLMDEQRLLTEQLLRDAIAIQDGSSSSWTGEPLGEEMQAGLGAAARLLDELMMNTNFMDGYLRAVVKLPLVADDANAGTLRDCCLALSRATLNDDDENATERMDETAKTWRKWLTDVGKGLVQLVGKSGDPPPSTGRVRSGQAASAYDWNNFGAVR